jgi:hypothetical protein
LWNAGFCRKVRFLGQNAKIGSQKFNDLQTAKLSKKQLCDRTLMLPGSTTIQENQIYKATEMPTIGKNVSAAYSDAQAYTWGVAMA